MLKIAALPALASGFLPRFVAGFSRNRPQVRIVVDGMSSPEIRDRVSAGNVDIGITAYPYSRDSLITTALYDSAVVVHAALPIGWLPSGWCMSVTCRTSG